jgi:heme/copper-type cytochrome/quinol oxidase subunit 2
MSVSRRRSATWAVRDNTRVVTVGSLLLPALPFADAPNPAFCPHHQCAYYHQVSAGGVAVLTVVAIVVVVLVLALVFALLRRRRRRQPTGAPNGLE